MNNHRHGFSSVLFVAGYKYKFLNKEYEDSFGLNVTETDFRQYDAAIGRFNVMDMLSELAYGITPYRYGFNNPVIWQDRTGLFESYLDARYYQLSNGLFGRSSIEYDKESGTWSINTGKSMITQIGDWIVTTYELDDGGMGADWNKAGNNKGHDYQKPNPEAKGKDPLYNPFGVVLTTDEGQDSPVTQSRGSRDAQIIDMNLLWYWATLLYGPDTKAPYELKYKKKKKRKSDVKQWFKYKSFRAAVPYLQDRYRAIETKKDTFMYGYDYYNTNWSEKTLYDSIRAVEDAKQQNQKNNLN